LRIKLYFEHGGKQLSISIRCSLNRLQRLTACSDEGGVEVSGEQWVRKVSEEFFQQSSHVVRIVLRRQNNVTPCVEVFT